jgi:diaminohydroxyphosphoribosylaminopyrimidine deaminase/5-amino-6-(5-phosphoribosylamino)uracil reductase
MSIALGLARKGLGRTAPNPMVGAVLVRDGEIVGRGYHRAAGKPHAEVEAILDAGHMAKGSDLYVTLEPCNHHGRTPPCSQAILEAGVNRVFIGMPDPNPSVKGGGAQTLREAGIEVHGPVLEARCKALNEVFIKNALHSRPFVYLKLAMTLDGRIATRGGDSQWITSEQARLDGRRLRERVSAIMVGAGTILADNPSLTSRLPNRKARDPIRIVADSNLRTPMDSRIFNPLSQAGVIIASKKDPPRKRVQALSGKGARIIRTKGADRVDLDHLMESLYSESITSLLLEGGAELAWSSLDAGIVDKCVFYYAPKIVGGRDAALGVGGAGVERLEDAILLRDISFKRIGPDMKIIGRVCKPDIDQW